MTTRDSRESERRGVFQDKDHQIQQTGFLRTGQAIAGCEYRLSVHIKDLFTSVFDSKGIIADIDGQTEAILSGRVSIADSNGSVAAGSPLHSARLGAGPRRVGTPVLSVGYSEVHVIWFRLDVLDSLDCVRDVGIVDERAIPDKEGVNA